MKAAIHKAGSVRRQCLQCRRVLKAGEAFLEQQTSSWYSNTATGVWHRTCIEGLLKKSAKQAAEATAVPLTKETLEEKFNVLREKIAKGETSLIA